jgi:hypothetical protein
VLGCRILQPNTWQSNIAKAIAAISGHRKDPRCAMQPAQRGQGLDSPASGFIALHPVIAAIGFLIYSMAVLGIRALGLTILYPLSCGQRR